MVDPQKVVVVKKWPRPTTPINIKNFLGLASYYRMLVESFSLIGSPLTKLTQKKLKFVWSDGYEGSFEKLKDKFTSAPILTLLKGTDGFVLYYDVSRMRLVMC